MHNNVVLSQRTMHDGKLNQLKLDAMFLTRMEPLVMIGS